MDDRELQELRRRVRSLLAELQGLDGFSERRAELPRTPEAFVGVPWRVILAHIDRATREAQLWMRDHEPTDDEYEYYDAVSGFAAEFVFGAEWSARAVHFALQRGEAIGLPPGRPETPYRSTTPLEISVSEGDVVSGDTRAKLQDFLDRLVPVAMDEPPELRAETTQRLKGATVRSHAASESLDAVESYRGGWRVPPQTKSRLRTFETNAAHALEATRHRLAGRSSSPTQRQGLRRLRSFLNAAVNGDYDAPTPFEPSDAPDRAKVRSAEVAALKAYALNGHLAGRAMKRR